MGFFDTVKEKAGAFATDAERAGKVTAAQARLLVLQNDLRKAERDLGHAAAALIEAGAHLHPDLGPSAARVRETREALRAKEAEIAALRAAGAPRATSTPPPTTAPMVEEEVAPADESPAAQVAAEAVAPAAAEEPPAKPAATKPAGGGKRAAKKPTAKKAPAKKTAGGAKPAGGKPAAKKPAAKRPAAKKPPASTE
jgi:hypothetical protein